MPITVAIAPNTSTHALITQTISNSLAWKRRDLLDSNRSNWGGEWAGPKTSGGYHALVRLLQWVWVHAEVSLCRSLNHDVHKGDPPID